MKILTTACSTLDNYLFQPNSVLQGMAMKFPEWFYCNNTCIRTVYGGRSVSKYSPWAAMHLAQWCCLEIFFFWNSCFGITFSAIVTSFGYSQYPKIFVPMPLFLETARSHSETNQRNKVRVTFQ